MKRIVATALAFACMVSLLAGCGKSAGKKEDNLIDQASKDSKNYVFHAEMMDIDGMKDINRVKVVGDRVYATTYSNSGYLTVVSFDQDGGNIKSVKIKESDNESHGQFVFDEQGNMYAIKYTYDWSEEGGPETYDDDHDNAGGDAGEDAEAGTDANEASDATEETSEPAEATDVEAIADESKTVDVTTDYDPMGPEGHMMTEGEGDTSALVKYDAEGNMVMNIDLSGESSGDDYFGISDMVLTEKYGLILSTTRGIETFSEDAGFNTLFDVKNRNDDLLDRSFEMFNGFDGKIYLTSYGEKGLELRTFDPEAKTVSDPSAAVNGYTNYSFLSGKGYDLYASTDDGVYGYDASKDEMIKILDFLDSDIDINYAISNIAPLSDTEMIAALPDDDYNYNLYRLTKVDPADVKDKKIITMAGYYINYNVRNEAVKFNRENDTYRIRIVDYSSYDSEDDWNAGNTQFNLDIVSGNVPDIMLFRGDNSVGSYANKGLFTDLNEFLSKDPDLANVEFIENVMDAYKTNGKQYLIAPSFYATTYTVKTKFLNGNAGMTLKEAEELIQAKGGDYMGAFGPSTKNEILESGITMAGSDYIDWENKSCNFNSDDFIQFLEFTNKFPTELPDDIWDRYTDTAYREDASLFQNSYLDGFRIYRRYKDGAFGEDISFIGFPNPSGKDTAVIYPEYVFAISSQSKSAEGAWQFLRKLLSEEYQDKIEYNFPIRKSSFDKMAEASKEKEFYMDDDKKVYYDDTYYLGDTEVTIGTLTDEDIQYVTNYIKSIKNVYSYNQSIMDIINEEAQTFYNGTKTAQEVADIIQSRVSIYVNENS
ncbi:MAG: extracellular solute-binding protein [Butyrivibrio sp.]|nr:extracellular solute-binding protein [Butyrivibrio sp.]